MDDKITSADDTAEYRFSDAEGVGEANVSVDEQQELGVIDTTAVNQSKLPFKFDLKSINWKRFATPGIVVVTILALYAVFSFYSSKKTSLTEQQKIMVQENAGLLQQQQSMADIATGSVVDNSNSDNQMMQIQGVMQQKIDSVLQQVQSGQSNITNMETTITKTQQDMVAIVRQVEQLTTVMQQMLVEIDKLTIAAKGKTKKKVFKLPVAYHVRAIVPGRAWLDSADGKSVTLRVGDKLEGYGVVKVIDSRQGMVVMSNGSIIQYGVGDF